MEVKAKKVLHYSRLNRNRQKMNMMKEIGIIRTCHLTSIKLTQLWHNVAEEHLKAKRALQLKRKTISKTTLKDYNKRSQN